MNSFEEKSNIDIIRDCYWRFLKREADEEGLRYYLHEMEAGNIDEKN